MIKDKISFCVMDKMVFIRNEYSPEYCNPRYTVHYYPTGINERDFILLYGKIEDQEFCNPSEQFHYGVYQFRIKGYGFRNWNKIILPQLAKTPAAKIDIIDIPCPNVKKGINTRYNGLKGYWEKELKTGWCSA